MNASPNPYASPSTAGSAPPLVAAVMIDDTGWTIEYELLLDDYIAWNMHYHRTSPVARRQAFLSWMVIGLLLLIVVFLLPSLAMDWPDSIYMSSVFAVPSAALWFCVPLIRRWKLRRVIRQMYVEGHNYNLIGPRRMSISRDYLAVSSPWSQSLMRWAGIAAIRREPDALYFCISSATAVIAPRRAFASGEQFEQFAQTARDFHAAARPSPVA